MMRSIFSSPHRALLLAVVAAAVFGLSFVPGFAWSTNETPAESDHLHHNHYAELAKVPEKARARHNPVENDLNAVAAGRKLFAQHCAECHGSSAEGGRKAPSLRAEEVRNASAGTLFWILTNGVVRRGMPVWSKLPEQQRWQIITFLKSLEPPLGTPSAPIDPR